MEVSAGSSLCRTRVTCAEGQGWLQERARRLWPSSSCGGPSYGTTRMGASPSPCSPCADLLADVALVTCQRNGARPRAQSGSLFSPWGRRADSAPARLLIGCYKMRRHADQTGCTEGDNTSKDLYTAIGHLNLLSMAINPPHSFLSRPDTLLMRRENCSYV